jgi:DNA processing protein
VDYTIVSGFAMGVDTIGHRAAAEVNGRTILVMPCGIDRPFRRRTVTSGSTCCGTVVSEFPFGTAASALTLRKRNKLIVSLASAVLVSQSGEKGGAMNAYRFSVEQRKPVATFEPDGSPETSGNRQIASPGEQTRLNASAMAALFTVLPDHVQLFQNVQERVRARLVAPVRRKAAPFGMPGRGSLSAGTRIG